MFDIETGQAHALLIKPRKRRRQVHNTNRQLNRADRLAIGKRVKEIMLVLNTVPPLSGIDIEDRGTNTGKVKIDGL